jgi:hypothetical protein
VGESTSQLLGVAGVAAIHMRCQAQRRTLSAASTRIVGLWECVCCFGQCRCIHMCTGHVGVRLMLPHGWNQRVL